MQNPFAVAQFLQSSRDHSPQLATGTLVDTTSARTRKLNIYERVTIEFGDDWFVKCTAEDLTLRGDYYGPACYFRQTVGNTIDAPVWGSLSPTRSCQRHPDCAEERKQCPGRHGLLCHISARVGIIHWQAILCNEKDRVCAQTHSSQPTSGPVEISLKY